MHCCVWCTGLSDVPGEAMVKLYCPKCQDVYVPKSSRHHHTDGAYFGTGFPHMLFMVHPEYRPKRPANQFTARLDNNNNTNNNKYASYPNWRRSPHADHCKTQIVYNTGRHSASGGVLLTPHTVQASLSHEANDRRTCYRFFNFWPWEAYPCATGHQKGRWPTIHRSTILQNFSLIAQTVYEICVTKVFSTFWPSSTVVLVIPG